MIESIVGHQTGNYFSERLGDELMRGTSQVNLVGEGFWNRPFAQKFRERKYRHTGAAQSRGKRIESLIGDARPACGIVCDVGLGDEQHR